MGKIYYYLNFKFQFLLHIAVSDINKMAFLLFMVINQMPGIFGFPWAIPSASEYNLSPIIEFHRCRERLYFPFVIHVNTKTIYYRRALQ